MLKSFLLAGIFLITSNFMPLTPVGVPSVSAAHTVAVTSANSTPLMSRPVNANITSDPTNDGLTPEEREFIERINAERTERGLIALTPDPLLVAVAREHSREMYELDYFDHHSPTPGITTPMDRYIQGLHTHGLSTPPYLLVGENIYYCSVFNDHYNVAYGHQALMNSPGHRANILEPRFAKIGIGIYQDARGQFWVTQMFLKDQQ